MNISDEIKAVRFFNNLHEKQLSLKKQKGKVLNYTANLCRHYYKSEALIKKALKKPSKLHYEVIGMIRLGCYLIEEDPQNTPKIIHHMVECIKPHHKWATSIVNGTLRNIVRNKDQWSQDMALSDKYNVPSWLFEKIAHHYPLHFEDIFNQWNQPPLHSARVRPHVNRDKLLSSWIKNGVKAHAHPHRNDMICIRSGAINELPGYQEGDFYIQNASALDLLEKVTLSEKALILDACAAPGGKSIFMADRWPKASITALDIDNKRIQKMNENLERTKLSIPIHCVDATETKDLLTNNYYDVVIVDAPCSATGVITKHPEIKLLRKEEDLKKVTEIQLKILKELWPKLKKGAQLVYLVCSILPEEGEEVIKKLGKSNNFTLEFSKTYLPSSYYHGFYGCIIKKPTHH